MNLIKTILSKKNRQTWGHSHFRLFWSYCNNKNLIPWTWQTKSKANANTSKVLKAMPNVGCLYSLSKKTVQNTAQRRNIVIIVAVLSLTRTMRTLLQLCSAERISRAKWTSPQTLDTFRFAHVAYTLKIEHLPTTDHKEI